MHVRSDPIHLGAAAQTRLRLAQLVTRTVEQAKRDHDLGIIEIAAVVDRHPLLKHVGTGVRRVPRCSEPLVGARLKTAGGVRADHLSASSSECWLSGTGFEDEVEWGFVRAAKAGEAAGGHDLAQPGLARLGAEREADRSEEHTSELQ